VRVHAIFPQTEIGSDPRDIARYARAVEDLGYDGIVAYDHVLGAFPDRGDGWMGPYTHETSFHEPMVLFGYLAALTTRVQLSTGVLVLPQRQTALVAKQAAALDVLTGGRMRLGVGIGWNTVEYEALGMEFGNRGRRMEEQIALLRGLWTEPVVTFEGRWDRVDRAGLNPLPVQRPIPVWIGADFEKAIQRVARMADGWFSQVRTDAAGRADVARFRAWVAEAGRDQSSVGIEGRVPARPGPKKWAEDIAFFTELGFTDVEFNTMGARYTSLDEHLDALARFYALLRQS
jgi:probable F420-dependent oxidoreductase